jgi:hypothetical protein
MTIPTTAGPDTICVCGHWYEEHYLPSDGDPAGCEGCFAARFGDAAEHGFEFDPEENAPTAIANRGGDPTAWPQWVKDATAHIDVLA